MSKEPCRPGKSKSVLRKELADKHNREYAERVDSFLNALEEVVAPTPIRSVEGQEIDRSQRRTKPGDIIIVGGGHGMSAGLINSFKDQIEPKVTIDGPELRNQTTYPKRYLERT